MPSWGAAGASRTEAVRLFFERAIAVKPNFEISHENVMAVTQICRRLDGLPLAIELAAARVRSMSPAEIAERLDDRFRLLTSGSRTALPRQRTLEATVAWSYEHLPASEQLLFDGLSVFAGGCTMQGAQHVCSDEQLDSMDVVDLVDHLVDRSLLIVADSDDGRTRYRMLETLRQFGRERLLERGTVERLRDRHLAWAAELADRLTGSVGLPPSEEALAEEDNLRTALEWGLDGGDPVQALRIVNTASVGRLEERARWYAILLERDEQAPPEQRGRARWSAGGVAFTLGDWPRTVELMQSAADAYAAAGDGALMSLCRCYEAMGRFGLGETDSARHLLQSALREGREAALDDVVERSLLFLAWLEAEAGNLVTAEELAVEGDDRSSRRATPFTMAHAREVLGFVRSLNGDRRQGAADLVSALELFSHVQWRCGAHVLETAAAWAAMYGMDEFGTQLWGAAQRIRDETGDRPRPWERAVQEHWLPRLHDHLEPGRFDAALFRGRGMTYDQAVAFAERSMLSG